MCNGHPEAQRLLVPAIDDLSEELLLQEEHPQQVGLDDLLTHDSQEQDCCVFSREPTLGGTLPTSGSQLRESERRATSSIACLELATTRSPSI